MKRWLKQITMIAGTLALLSAFQNLAHADLQSEVTEGYVLIDQWRFEEAEAQTQKLLEKYPNSGDVHFLYARVEFYKGNYEKAWKILETVDDKYHTVKEFKTLVKNTREATSVFVSQESEHFIFRYVDGPDQVLIPYAKEVLERSYEVLGKILGYFPKKKVLVEIYPDRIPFARISPLTLKDIVTSGTVALCKYNRLMMISPGSLVRGYDWMDTLSHEYTHFLLSSKSYNNAPLWLHEGYAKYLETRWRDDPQYMTPIMETILANGLANDYMVALEDMMPSLAKLKSAEDVQLAYAEVATMVDYMVQVKGESVLEQLATDLALGTPFENALESAIGQNLTDFQTAWKNHMGGRKLRKIPGLTVLKFQFKNNRSKDEKEMAKEAALEEAGNQRAHDLTLLGDILKARQHIKAAIIEYQKAIEESKMLSPILYNKLAGTYLLQKDFNQAEDLLRTSLNFYPQFATTLTHLGELFYMKKDYAMAEDFFQKAVRINPFNPLVHARLINIYAALDQAEKMEQQGLLYSYIK
ncbi:MAG: tetratricopeptide repeat protein [Nitrospinota bacterium]|nr:tetratricopeptide repeat protein [Nitrospinota bacterium]